MVVFLLLFLEWFEGLVIFVGYEVIIEVKCLSLILIDNVDCFFVGYGYNVCIFDVFLVGKYLVFGGWDGKVIIWGMDKWE